MSRYQQVSRCAWLSCVVHLCLGHGIEVAICMHKQCISHHPHSPGALSCFACFLAASLAPALFELPILAIFPWRLHEHRLPLDVENTVENTVHITAICSKACTEYGNEGARWIIHMVFVLPAAPPKPVLHAHTLWFLVVQVCSSKDIASSGRGLGEITMMFNVYTYLIIESCLCIPCMSSCRLYAD